MLTTRMKQAFKWHYSSQRRIANWRICRRVWKWHRIPQPLANETRIVRKRAELRGFYLLHVPHTWCSLVALYRGVNWWQIVSEEWSMWTRWVLPSGLLQSVQWKRMSRARTMIRWKQLKISTVSCFSPQSGYALSSKPCKRLQSQHTRNHNARSRHVEGMLLGNPLTSC